MKSYKDKMVDKDYLNLLCKFITLEYEVEIINIRPAPRGFYGETWEIITPIEKYFVKIDYFPKHKNIYKQSFDIIEFMNQEGIDFICKILKNKEDKLWVKFNEGIMGVFHWIEGVNHNELTDDMIIIQYKLLAQIYKLKTKDLLISYEKFDGKSAASFFEGWNRLGDCLVSRHLEIYRPLLEHKAKRLEYFAEICRHDNTNYFITHGDSSRNIMSKNDKYYIIDWDAPLFAPPERDAWLCLDKWALKKFNDILAENNISYELKSERLSYYGCYSFFLYLNEFIDKYNYVGNATNIIKEIDIFINNWFEKECKYAMESKLIY